jgi:predicted RNase H-like HicB family nuclease
LLSKPQWDICTIAELESELPGFPHLESNLAVQASSKCASKNPEGVLMQIEFHFYLFGVMKREGGWYIAHCPPLDITTQGKTASEARQNLHEAAELFVISCMERGTLDQALRELGFVSAKRLSRPLPDKGFRMNIPVPLRFQKNRSATNIIPYRSNRRNDNSTSMRGQRKVG